MATMGFEQAIASSIVINVPDFLVRFRLSTFPQGRIVEDIGSQSPEGSTIVPNFNGGIANPGPSTDIAVNEKEVTYTQAQFLAKNPSGNPSSKTYVPVVAGCTAGNDTFFGVGGPFLNGLNQVVGGACILNVDTADAGPGDGIPDGFGQITITAGHPIREG